MAFTGNEGKVITLSEASDWTAAYRATISQGDTLAHFFGRDNLEAILDQEGCMGIRIYYAIDEPSSQALVLVGADAAENDMENGVIVDKSVKCPPMCGNGSKLNS